MESHRHDSFVLCWQILLSKIFRFQIIWTQSQKLCGKISNKGSCSTNLIYRGSWQLAMEWASFQEAFIPSTLLSLKGSFIYNSWWHFPKTITDSIKASFKELIEHSKIKFLVLKHKTLVIMPFLKILKWLLSLLLAYMWSYAAASYYCTLRVKGQAKISLRSLSRGPNGQINALKCS